jgi:AcrR family transcriptional regulator
LRVQRYGKKVKPPNFSVKKCEKRPLFAHLRKKCASFSCLNETIPLHLHRNCRTKNNMPLQKTKLLLIDVARQLFAKKGFEYTTMNDIAEASGKGRRTLYIYFKSKDEVYSAVINGELQRISSTFLAVARKQLPPLEKLVELMFAHLSLMKEAVERNGNLRAEFFRNIWQVERVRKKYDKKERDIIAKTLEDGQREGIFDIENIDLYTDIIQGCARGLEVPYIYGRVGTGMNIGITRPIVTNILRKALGRERNIIIP